MTSFRSILLAAAATVAFSGAAMAGDNNYGSAEQHGADNASDILQIGDTNKATVYQENTTPYNTTNGNVSDIVMEGDRNEMLAGNTKRLDDNGTSNDPTLVNTSSYATSHGVEQIGTNNTQGAYIRGDDNIGRVYQEGDGNDSTVYIRASANYGMGNDNKFWVTQVGNSNVSDADVAGSNNWVSTFQHSNSNQAYHTIDGDSNNSHITQY